MTYFAIYARKIVDEVCSFVGIKCCSGSYTCYLQYAMLPYCHIFQNSSYLGTPLNLISRDFAKFLCERHLIGICIPLNDKWCKHFLQCLFSTMRCLGTFGTFVKGIFGLLRLSGDVSRPVVHNAQT